MQYGARVRSRNVTGFLRAEMNAEFRRQNAKWTREALVRKAQAGHVTGGRVFGYLDKLLQSTTVSRPISRRFLDRT